MGTLFTHELNSEYLVEFVLILTKSKLQRVEGSKLKSVNLIFTLNPEIRKIYHSITKGVAGEIV